MFASTERGSIGGKCGVTDLACKEPMLHRTRNPNPLLQSENGSSSSYPCLSGHAFLALVTGCHETECTAQLSAYLLLLCSLCSFPWANQLTVSVEGKGWEGQCRIQEFHFCQNHTTTKTLAAIIQNILGCLQVLVCYVMHSTWLAIVSHWWRRLFSPWLRSSQPLFCKPCLFSLCHTNYFLFVECIA